MIVWKPETARLHRQLVFEGEWPTSVALVQGGRRVAAGNRNGELYVWDLTTEPPAGNEAETDDGKQEEGTAPDVPPVLRLVGHTNAISRLIASPDGRHLYSSSYDHTICVWDLEQTAAAGEPVILNRRTREQQARRLPTKDREAFLNAPGPTVPVLKPARVLAGHQEWIYSLALSADGTRLASGDASANVVLWDVAAGKPSAQWKGQPWNWIFSLAISPDGESVLVSEYRYKRDDFDIPAAALRTWNTADGTVRQDLLQLKFPKFKPEESSYGSASVWRKFVANGLLGAACSPDGRMLAVGQSGETGSGKVHLFEAETGAFVRSVGEHRGGVTDAGFSPDGKHVLSTGRDTSLLVTDVETGKEVIRLGKSRGGQFKDWFHALDFAAVADSSETGYRLAAADIAGLVHVWNCDA